MKKQLLFFGFLIFGVGLPMVALSQPVSAVWLTTLDQSSLLTEKTSLSFSKQARKGKETLIEIQPDSVFQQVDGFGFALTGGSAQHLMNMPVLERKKLLKEMFGTGKDEVGFSYLRLSIGASDLNAFVFSYNDLPNGETDVELKRFDLGQDKLDVIPVLKEILTINPNIKIMGSPWSAPAWMKTNNNIQGGRLQKAYYGVYAQYFVKYIQAMKSFGISIEAITIQNEPFNNGNTPSMQMFAKEQAHFIKSYLGPAFASQKIRTKIVLYDHNCDAPEYPISILTDKAAAKYINGSGFHLYGQGPITAMSKVHQAFPNKHLYFTEMMAVNSHEFRIATPVSRIVIGALRNWSRNVILWNLAANSKNEPHTDNGGCSMCQGAVTIDGSTVQRNLAYYTIGQISKFVRPGAFRIFSTASALVPNVAFKTPEGKMVVVVANPTLETQSFILQQGANQLSYSLESGDVVSFIWKD